MKWRIVTAVGVAVVILALGAFTCVAFIRTLTSIQHAEKAEPTINSAPVAQWGKWQGKTIKRVEVVSGYEICIHFVDGPPLILTSYKYAMRLQLEREQP